MKKHSIRIILDESDWSIIQYYMNQSAFKRPSDLAKYALFQHMRRYPVKYYMKPDEEHDAPWIMEEAKGTVRTVAVQPKASSSNKKGENNV